MAAFAQRSRARFEPAADPNVIPFIDVLLVLLIIFMVTAPKPTTDLRVDLPRPGTAIPVVIPPTIVHV
jgi:biopolymer transport protein ExbD